MISILYLGQSTPEKPAWEKELQPTAVVHDVAEGAAFERALRRGGYDLIFADIELALAGSPSPLQLARSIDANLPFVVLAPHAAEGLALAALDHGASDCVLISEPRGFAIALRRAAAERAIRQKLQAAVQQLRACEERCAAAERQTRELNASWEHILAERTSASAAALKELEAFSYSVSHDLRAPLRAILGFARALKEDCGPQLGTEGLRLLDTIGNEARRMSLLIDDLLAFSRAGRQQIDRSNVDMTELARSAFQTITEAMREPGPALDLSALPEIEGDRSMLRQVFANLLGNAVKFSGGRPVPRIEVSGWTEGAENIYRVKDNGVGFDARYAHRLFGVFQRLHREEEFEGTGVGLALVQRIVQRHGGRVWGESTLNEGASFYFALPLPSNPAPEPAATNPLL